MNLQEAVGKLVEKHGTQAAAARVAQISDTYLNLLMTGKYTSPSKAVLRRLGIRPKVVKVVVKTTDYELHPAR